MNFPVIKGYDNKTIQPRNLMLHDNESKLVFLDEKNNDTIFMFDLEKGKICEQLQGGKDVRFTKVANETKNGQKEVNRTLLGIDHNSIFQLDPRLKSGESVVNEKTYKTPINFTSLSSSMQGGFALGNAKGEIRLYKQVGQIAKTLLPGMGEPIKSIDVSLDGEWLLATC